MRKSKLIGVCSIIIGALFIALGIVMLPKVTDFGINFLYYVLACLVLVYTFGLLLRRCIRSGGTRQVLYIIEIVLNAVIALSLIINEIGTIINIKEAMLVIGIVLWLHFLFSIFRGFKVVEKKYPFYMVVIDALGLSFATYLIVKPPLGNQEMVIIASCICFAFALGAIIYGILLVIDKIRWRK